MNEMQLKEIEVNELATVAGYQCDTQGVADFFAKPMEIYLICMKAGSARIQASFIPHPLELTGGEAIFLAFPKSEWEAKVLYQPGVEFYTIRMEASTLHQLINPVFDSQNLASAKKIDMRDLMKLIPVSPPIIGCFDQLLHHKLQIPFRALFERAKFLEIFSLIMESAFNHQLDACPVMITPAIENKLHQVRRHIISEIDVVPDPDHLAVIYELPRNTLREGYRYVFGKTIHQYHADHKMESAMQMLNSGELLVKEIAFKIGYQNPSHFIAAFKKKFGYTPKQYLKRETAVG